MGIFRKKKESESGQSDAMDTVRSAIGIPFSQVDLKKIDADISYNGWLSLKPRNGKYLVEVFRRELHVSGEKFAKDDSKPPVTILGYKIEVHPRRKFMGDKGEEYAWGSILKIEVKDIEELGKLLTANATRKLGG